ncbi:hypothetical protein [Niabella beijingensis]|uniref:Nmad2 family putative nucleotide modification protein n=1 Tax=Niabella beijingensis TaxID=2872700 RepID=UPI001CBC3ABB|nr:hypothetical protein [Niabella beijingensis]MBZ4187636.1 hypothetical protein [Niabella beijingensis]
MAKLFSYCIPFDNGAAPNPFWGMCTLNICKPVIRKVAQVGDWIVGTGSARHRFENKVVYAMEVTAKMTMAEYDLYCKKFLPEKIPNWRGKSYKERVGDCIYDFSTEPPKLLKSVHVEENRRRDLSGVYTLLSDHFYYFGDHPEPLPDYLLPIVNQGQGYKSTLNKPYFEAFVDWIMSQAKAKNSVYSEPKERMRFAFTTDVECGHHRKCSHTE